jgi:hypothetical protein
MEANKGEITKKTIETYQAGIGYIFDEIPF